MKCGCGNDMPFDYGIFLPSHLMYGSLCLTCYQSLIPWMPRLLGLVPQLSPEDKEKRKKEQLAKMAEGRRQKKLEREQLKALKAVVSNG